MSASRSNSQPRGDGRMRGPSATRQPSLKTMGERPQRLTEGQGSPGASNGSGGGKKMRSSIDLELQLGFERNPLDKPSSDFRDADQWYTKAKETAEQEVAMPGKAAGRSSTRTSAGFGLWGANRTSRHANVSNDVDGGEEPEYSRPKNENRTSFFRGSFFGGVSRDISGGGAPLPSSGNARRPMGPRNLNVGSEIQMQSVANTTLARDYKNMGDSELDPAASLTAPKWFFQLRVWSYILILICSTMGTAIVGGLASSPLAPNRVACNFFLFVCILSILVAVLELAVYILRGSHLLYHYDSPFLLLFSSGDDRSLSRSGALGAYLDMVVHGILILFWVATLANIGVANGGCRQASLSVAGTNASVCTGYEAGVGFGAIAIIAEVFATGMKSWELMSNWGAIRKALH